jgi:ribulose-phosphate 3-epimerase
MPIPKISPSLLSADFAKLGEEAEAVSKAGADYLHIDVMDGAFVPNITYGPVVYGAIRSYTDVPFDVHLMIEKPEQHIDMFAKVPGTAFIVVHEEACVHLERTLRYIKSLGIGCGVALNPSTHPASIEYVADVCDQILVMSVNPGYAGQSFIESSVKKVQWLKDLKEKGGYTYEIAVDGGVSEKTSPALIKAGADILVAGSAVFGKEDYAKAIGSLRTAKK